MPISAQTFTPEEIDLANWLGDDEAKSILRSMAYNAPTFEWKVETYALTRDEVCIPTGHRYERLTAIWYRYWDAVCETGSFELQSYFMNQLPRPADAVDGALSASPIIKRVALIAKHRDPVAAGQRARAA
jgi:hypothetical protein